MRAAKMIALGLAVLLASSTVTACGVLRTPYERQKIAENGGQPKKKEEGGGEKKGGSAAADVAGGAKTKGAKAKAMEAEKKEAEKKSIPGRAENVGEAKEREKGQGLLYVMPQVMEKKRQEDAQWQAQQTLPKTPQIQGIDRAKLEERDPHLIYNQTMSTEVAKIEGVEGSTVLLDEQKNAYVALTSDPSIKRTYVKAPTDANLKFNVKTEGEIPQPLQEKIATKLRKIDTLVETVYITTDPEHVANFQRYAVKLSNGGAIDMNSKALAEHIQDIWK